MFPILLASASPRRRQLLEQVGFCVTVVPTDTDELPFDAEQPVALAQRLARSKAAAAAGVQRQGAEAAPNVGIAADTVVWDEDETIYDKPTSPEDAARSLRALSGRSHHVTTAFCLFDPKSGVVQDEDSVTTSVSFRTLTEQDIEAYVATGEPTGKAGGYGIQGLGAVLVRGIVGSYTNVVGLPVEHVVARMRERELLTALPWVVDGRA